MADRADIVKRVVASLSADEDEETALVRYLHHDRDILVASILETLQATGDDVTERQVEQRVERELLEDLRWRPTLTGPARIAGTLWIHRQLVGFTAGLLGLVGIVAALIL